MVKIAAFPKCWIYAIGPGKKYSLFQWIELSGQLDVDGLELYPTFFDSYDASYLQAVRAAVEKTERCIPMFCCSPDLSHPDPQELAQQMELQKKNMRAAAALGCRTCRVLSGQQHSDMSIERGIDQVITCINELLPLAYQFDLILAMENHYKDGAWRFPEFAQKKEVFLHIVRAIDDPHFGVQFDPSNAIVAGDDPIELLETIKDRVVSMHASDRFLLPGHTLDELAGCNGNLGYSPILCHGEIGKGLNDYDRIFSILAAAGYQGWISIEDGENGLDEMKRSADFLKKMRQRYYGS